MSGLVSAYLAALALGAMHALEVDHVAAVTAFVGSRPRLPTAVSFGMRWGAGHATILLAVGIILVSSGVTSATWMHPWNELVVGLSLVALGCWMALRWYQRNENGGSHHSANRERNISTLVGSVHGMAGTAPAVALLPVAMTGSRVYAFGYLALFGLGTIAAMTAYTAIIAVAMRKANRLGVQVPWLAYGAAGVSVAVGLLWLVRAAVTPS